jgi:UDP-3-O-acyl N-acetylglucosamine deacetylase
MPKQCTLTKAVTFNGFGIHTCQFAEVTLTPLKENTGIQFRASNQAAPYTSEFVQGDARGTQVILGPENTIMTVEHLVSSLVGLGIDNVLIDVDGPEIPIKDGSPKFFVDKILEAGITEQPADRNYFTLPEPILLEEKDKAILAVPADKLSVTFLIDYPDSFIKTDSAIFTLTKEAYIKELSRARTYGFTHEIAALVQSGKGLGATRDNAIVIGENGYSVPLHYPNELARHKIVDFLGDIRAIGAIPLAHFYVVKSGHAFNHRFIQKLIG